MRSLTIVIAGGLMLCPLALRAAPGLDHAPPLQLADAEGERREREAVQNAAGAGKLHEDPRRHALRQAVLNAANRAEASPCDTRLRRALSDAFDAYHRHMEATADDRVETLTLADGRVIDVSHHFDNPVEDAWRFALTAPCEN